MANHWKGGKEASKVRAREKYVAKLADPIEHEKLKAADRARYAARVAEDAAAETLRTYIRKLRTRYKVDGRPMTLDDYNAFSTKQNGLCAICKRHKKLHIDHDHETGNVRGLLCSPCNTTLGRAGDNEEGLMRFVSYLRGEL